MQQPQPGPSAQTAPTPQELLADEVVGSKRRSRTWKSLLPGPDRPLSDTPPHEMSVTLPGETQKQYRERMFFSGYSVDEADAGYKHHEGSR